MRKTAFRVKQGIRLLTITALLISLITLSNYEHHPEKVIEQRFVKIHYSGQVLTPWQGPWACTLDKKTGLYWENKSDDESIHDGQWTYSWYLNGLGAANNGDCFFEAGQCDTQDLIARMNQEKTCGLTNWRLPTQAELSSLVFESPKTGKAAIRNDFFSHTKRGDYWTAEHSKPLTGTYHYLNNGASSVNFIDGQVSFLPYRNAAYVRLVSSPIELIPAAQISSRSHHVELTKN